MQDFVWQQKAMTDNARHGEHQTPPSVSYLWAGAKKSATINDSGIGCRSKLLLAEMERLNIPLHTTFYCFIKLLVNHAFTSFKPFHLFRISQAYIYNSALSCIIRVRKISRLRPIKSPRRLKFYLLYLLCNLVAKLLDKFLASYAVRPVSPCFQPCVDSTDSAFADYGIIVQLCAVKYQQLFQGI